MISPNLWHLSKIKTPRAVRAGAIPRSILFAMHNILYLPTSNEIVDVVKAPGDEIVGYSKQKSTTHNRIVPLKLAFKGANTRRTRKPPRSIVNLCEDSVIEV